MKDLINSILNLGITGDSSGGNSFWLFLLILIVPIAIFFFYRSRKKKQNQDSGPIQRHEGDEVWKTVKDFLKGNDELGKEIVETYVAKRPDPNFIPKTLSKEEKIKKKQEIKARKLALKEENKQLKAQGKNPKINKPKELYVVLFTTRNPKTLKEDKPRAIECEVKMVKVNKTDTERKIVILGERDYKKESKWILPIKELEEAKLKKEIAKREKSKGKFLFFKKKQKPVKEVDEMEIYMKNKEIKEKENKKWEKKEKVEKSKK